MSDEIITDDPRDFCEENFFYSAHSEKKYIMEYTFHSTFEVLGVTYKIYYNSLANYIESHYCGVVKSKQAIEFNVHRYNNEDPFNAYDWSYPEPSELIKQVIIEAIEDNEDQMGETLSDL